jgi:hypothetical protein
MASLTISLETEATGPLALTHGLSEADAQRIFAALLGLAAPITDQRETPDPADEAKTILEFFERPRRLGECLIDRVNGFVHTLLEDVSRFEEQQAVEAAKAKRPEPIKVEVK